MLTMIPFEAGCCNTAKLELVQCRLFFTVQASPQPQLYHPKMAVFHTKSPTCAYLDLHSNYSESRKLFRQFECKSVHVKRGLCNPPMFQSNSAIRPLASTLLRTTWWQMLGVSMSAINRLTRADFTESAERAERSTLEAREMTTA